jgi:hypothetical protein
MEGLVSNLDAMERMHLPYSDVYKALSFYKDYRGQLRKHYKFIHKLI